MNKIDLIAYYLPQFHVIPENESWWEKGFTEWSQVKKAKKLFSGHKQPVLPGILGYYDLLNERIRDQQATLAKDHGINAFCYYHYWFGNGKTLLEKPIQEVLLTQKPDQGFCLCWANESWGGVWHGKPRKILMKQEYPGIKDMDKHLEYLAPIFEDKRYYRVDHKPLFQIHKAESLPDPKNFVEKFRERALKMGLGELFILAGYNHSSHFDHQKFGFDGCVSNAFTESINDLSKTQHSQTHRVFQSFLSRFGLNQPARYPYLDFISKMKYYNAKKDQIPLVLPNWDNTPRMKRLGYVLENSNPDLFIEHLNDAIQSLMTNKYEHKMVFIKSWNEWAEGNYLEPDSNGKDYLEKIRDLKR